MLWDRSPQRTVFSRLEYVRAVAAAADLETTIAVVRRGGRDVAGAAVTWKRRGPYREIIVPPVTPFSAILLGQETAENKIHGRTSGFELLLEALERSFHAVRLHLPTAIRDVRPASWRGWDVQPFYTYVLSLPTKPSEWSGGVTRNFERSRTTYDVIEGGDAASAVVHLCFASYARHDRRPPLGEQQLALLVDSVQSSGLATIYGLRHRKTGAIDAAVAVARAATTASYWLAGSVPGPAMTVLIGELFPRLTAEGIDTFDFVGANTPGIAEFKRKFGSNLMPYYRIVRIGRRELKLVYKIRSILR